MLELDALPTDGRVRRLGRPALGVIVGNERADACERTVGPRGGVQVDDGGQTLRPDHDEIDGVGCRGFGLGHDDRHRLAGEERLVAGERFEHPHVVGADDREVGGRQDGDDPGELERGRGVDSQDPGVGVETRDDPGVEQAEHRPVGGIPRGAPNLLLGIRAGARDAESSRRLSQSVDHRFLLPVGRSDRP